MTFLELYNRVIQKLKERSDPKFWTLDEIKENLNAGCREFARDAVAKKMTVPLLVADATAGTFLLPPDIMVPCSVKWNGDKIHHVDHRYLDGITGQNASAPQVLGEDVSESSDWRTATADDPTHWLMDNGLLRIYPIPTDFAAVASVRTKQEATLSAGATTLTVTGNLPSDEGLVDVYLKGVWQNSDQWSIGSTTTIVFTEASPVALEAEVVFFPSTASASSTKTFKYILSGVAGQQSFNTPRPYVVGGSALSVKINGVSQAPSKITETSSTTFSLDAALTFAAEIEVTIIEDRTAYDLTMLYVKMPEDMVADTDAPDLPFGLDYYHKAIWEWALFECFSREGQTKNVNMAEFYLSRYNRTIGQYKDAFGASVFIEPLDAWRL